MRGSAAPYKTSAIQQMRVCVPIPPVSFLLPRPPLVSCRKSPYFTRRGAEYGSLGSGALWAGVPSRVFTRHASFACSRLVEIRLPILPFFLCVRIVGRVSNRRRHPRLWFRRSVLRPSDWKGRCRQIFVTDCSVTACISRAHKSSALLSTLLLRAQRRARVPTLRNPRVMRNAL